MSERATRRLAAIVAADVAGYSRLVGLDEEGTLALLKAHRRELIDPLIAAHGGRIANTAGDSLLLEFPSAVEAVRCALAVQQGMAARNAERDDDRRIRFRIGITVGDVVAEGADLLGDGVNVAARLQEIAEPGGISLSRRVHEDVQDRLDAPFVDAGPQALKNIARPIHVWRWAPDVSGGQRENRDRAQPPALPDKPSIVVLPFDNMSGDPEQAYFADGITEDIITDLSRFPALFVIARNTAFTYKGEKIDVAKVARELGVHFVLEGSVRKAGARVRVTAQLIDGGNGRHLWAQRYDGELADVFDLQESVTRQVVANVAPHIDKAELDRAFSGVRRFDEAHDLAWQSYASFQHGIYSGQPELVDQAIALAGRALALNQRCRLAYTSICWSYAMQNLYTWGDDPAGAADRALRYAEAAMLALPQTSTAYNCLGVAKFRKRQYEQAVRDFRSAHEQNPNDVHTLFALAWGEATLGDAAAAREHAGEALRLSPKDLWSQTGYLSLAMAAFVERRHEEFVEWAEIAIQAMPVAPIRRAMMIAHAAEVGNETLARIHLDELNRFAPDFIASLFRGENRLFARDEHMQMLLDGLGKAGLPAEG